ncbi:MAG TPA: hypothetical protein VF841_20810 [Anaeromyxobacter sp.]
MKTRSAVLLGTLAAVAAGVAGCPSSTSCPLETPQVTALPTCTEPPNYALSYPVRLCPTCNQTAATCSVQMSGTDIFLDLKVEACGDSTSCGGAGCSPGPTVCSFTTPAEGTYRVSATDAGGTVSGTLVVSASAPASCALPTAGL